MSDKVKWKAGDVVFAGSVEAEWGKKDAKVVIETTTIKSASSVRLFVKDRLGVLGYGVRFNPSTKRLFTSRRAVLEALHADIFERIEHETERLRAVTDALAKEKP